MGTESALDKDTEECKWFETLLKKQNHDRSLARVIDVQITNALPAGENYASLISRGTLTVLLSSGCKSKLSVIIKKEHEVKEKAAILEEMNMFKNEIRVYKDVLERCEELMNEFQDTNDKLWGNLIGFIPYNYILFEDLKAQNFKVADRTKMLDLNHALLVLHSLGRLHGLCHVLIKKGLLAKGDLQSVYNDLNSPIVDISYRSGFSTLVEVIEKFWAPEWEDVGKLIHRQKDIVVSKLKEIILKKENSFLTMCHGDCWTTNLMFKYCPYEENKPIALKFLDFQACHVNSYIFDLIHFIYGSVRPQIRRDNFDLLLSTYQKSLKSTLSIYGMEQNTPTLEEIYAEHKRAEYFAFSVTTFVLAVTTADVKEAAINIESFSEKSNGQGGFNPEIFKSDLFMNNFQKEIRGWIKKGLF